MGGFLQCFEWYFDIQIFEPQVRFTSVKSRVFTEIQVKETTFLTPNKIHILKWNVFCSVLNGTLTFIFLNPILAYESYLGSKK